MPSVSSSSFQDDISAIRVLHMLRSYGTISALTQLEHEFSHGFNGPLLTELYLRLNNNESPRLIIDGVWLSQITGGIQRVWRSILSTFSLPGICSSSSPIALINRSNILPSSLDLELITGQYCDPTDPGSISSASIENSLIVKRWKADVFCSTWVTNSGCSSSCTEIALIHDCIPEHFYDSTFSLAHFRSLLFHRSSRLLTVSSDTASDISRFYGVPNSSISWCHPFSDLSSEFDSCQTSSFWNKYLTYSSLNYPFILLPGSSLVGTYKNPEFIAQALLHSSLLHLNLLITGTNSSFVKQSLLSNFPSLSARIFAAGFTHSELSVAFKQALAVIIPSRIEGFGLPVIEALSVGAVPVVSDVLGLREAGSEAALRFHPDHPIQLVNLLNIFLHSESRSWISNRLNRRVSRRLARLHQDLLGISLLSLARSAQSSN